MSPSSQPTLWRTCRVLANRKRLQILALLIRQPNQTVSTVAGRMSLSMPTASQYLRALEARGLLTCRRVGRRVEYRPSAGKSERAAEEIANRTVCADFEKFEPIFERVKRELKSGIRHTLAVQTLDEIRMAEIQKDHEVKGADAGGQDDRAAGDEHEAGH